VSEMIDVKLFAAIQPGDILTIGTRHPHGPTTARVVAMEQVMGSLSPRCRALDKFGEDDYGDPAEFFVMDRSDIVGVRSGGK
jgi:hypothetical protein